MWTRVVTPCRHFDQFGILWPCQRYKHRWTREPRETPEILRDELAWSVSTHPPLSIELPRLFDRIVTVGRVRTVPRQ